MPDTDDSKPPAFSPTTRWSLILAAVAAGDQQEKAREALEQLCRIYWQPVLRFVLRKGYSLPDAQDLTQDFFVRLSEAEFLKQADPQKGRFRFLVIACLKNLLFDAADRLKALKRGGGHEFLRLEEWMEDETEFACSTAPGLSVAQAEQLFDYEWAALVVRKALARLRDEFSASGREREFGVIRGFLTGEANVTSYAEAAATLRLPVGTLKPMIHRSRARFATLLRDEVSQTLADLRDLDDEIRHLCRILASRGELGGISAA